MVYGMNSVRIQGVLVVVNGVGVLVRGPSGCGKSLAALNLMRKGHHFVADDLVEVVSGGNGRLVGRPVENDSRIEVRGLGIFRARDLFENGTLSYGPIDFVAQLDSYDPLRDAGRTVPEIGRMHLLDRDLPTVRLPVPLGCEPGFLIELLAGLFKNTGALTP